MVSTKKFGSTSDKKLKDDMGNILEMVEHKKGEYEMGF